MRAATSTRTAKSVRDPARGSHGRADPLEAPVEVDESAVLLEPGGHREDDVSGGSRGGEEQIIADHQRAGRQRGPHRSAVGVGGEHVLADHPQGLQRPAPGGREHLRDPKSRPQRQARPPGSGEAGPRFGINDLLVSGQQIGEGSHVRCSLDVVLSAQRVHPSAGAGSDGPAQEGQVGEGPDTVRAVQVFGHPESIEDRRSERLPVHQRRAHQVLRRDAGDFSHAVRWIVAEQPEQFLVAAGAGIEEVMVHQPLADQQVREAVEHGHVGSRLRPKVDVGVPGQCGAPGIDHHQTGALHDPLEDPGADDRVRRRRVGADQEDRVAPVKILERIRPAAQTERGGQACSGGGVTEPGTVVHVVRAHDGPGEFLGQIVLLVRGPGRRNKGKSIRIFVPDFRQPGGHVRDRLIP